MPVQQASLSAQTSPLCKQNDGCPEHFPLLQNREQQSPCPLQVLPAVLQLALSG